MLAKKGKKVGIVDTDIQSPGIHVLFGFEPESIKALAQRLPLG
jgi:MinD-like ATPase involved in chromosome partitioning or flagellar assembly